MVAGKLDNRELDKLVGALGRSRATWRRALLLHEWLLGLGHAPDDRLCTTLIRVCAQHGQVRCMQPSLFAWQLDCCYKRLLYPLVCIFLPVALCTVSLCVSFSPKKIFSVPTSLSLVWLPANACLCWGRRR